MALKSLQIVLRVLPLFGKVGTEGDSQRNSSVTAATYPEVSFGHLPASLLLPFSGWAPTAPPVAWPAWGQTPAGTGAGQVGHSQLSCQPLVASPFIFCVLSCCSWEKHFFMQTFQSSAHHNLCLPILTAGRPLSKKGT